MAKNLGVTSMSLGCILQSNAEPPDSFPKGPRGSFHFEYLECREEEEAETRCPTHTTAQARGEVGMERWVRYAITVLKEIFIILCGTVNEVVKSRK